MFKKSGSGNPDIRISQSKPWRQMISFSSGYFSIILPMAQMNVYKNAANPDPDFSGKIRILETAFQIEL